MKTKLHRFSIYVGICYKKYVQNKFLKLLLRTLLNSITQKKQKLVLTSCRMSSMFQRYLCLPYIVSLTPQLLLHHALKKRTRISAISPMQSHKTGVALNKRSSRSIYPRSIKTLFRSILGLLGAIGTLVAVRKQTVAVEHT